MTRTERTYYLVFGLYNVSWSFIGPIYALFLLGRGLDLFEINIVLATYLITAFFFEVPTGALADVFGRKASFLLSCVLRMTAFILYARSDTLGQFLIAEFIDAIGTTLASGALEAWAIDGTRAEGSRCPADRLFARAAVLSRGLMVLSGVAGGYLADAGMSLPWLVGAAAFALSGITAAFVMREDTGRAERNALSRVLPMGLRPAQTTLLWGTMRDGLRSVRTSPFLLALCLLTCLTAFASMPIHMLWQPRMQALAGNEYRFMGWIWALINLFSLAGSALIPRLLGRLARPVALSATALWRAATLALAAVASTLFPALAGLLLQEVGFGVSEPVLQAWINEHVSAERRATVLSVRAMSFTFGGAAGLLCLGVVARAEGIPTAWLIGSAVLLLTAPGLLLLGRLAPRPAELLLADGTVAVVPRP